MDNPVISLIVRSGRSAAMYAGGAAVIFFILFLISKVPILGIFVLCLNFLLSLAAFFLIAYLVTPRLTDLPSGTAPALNALYIGFGIAVVTTVGFVIAELLADTLGTVFDIAFSGSSYGPASIVSEIVGIVFRLIGWAFYGLVLGTVLSFLGAFVRVRNRAG